MNSVYVRNRDNNLSQCIYMGLSSQLRASQWVVRRSIYTYRGERNKNLLVKPNPARGIYGGKNR